MRQEENQEEILKDLIEIGADDSLIGGAVLIFIGSLLSALGVTNVLLTRSPQGAEGIAIGNGIESVGNVLQAVAKENLYVSQLHQGHRSGVIGSLLQAVGNAGTAVVVPQGLPLGLFAFEYVRRLEEGESIGEIEEEIEEESPLARIKSEKLRRNIEVFALTNVIQAIGAFVEADSIASLPPFATQQLEINGDLLTGIGSLIEAAGLYVVLIDETKEIEDVVLETIGSWIQVVGAAMGLIALTTEGELHKQEFDEKYRYSYRRYTT